MNTDVAEVQESAVGTADVARKHAIDLTNKIRTVAGGLTELLIEAYHRQVWTHLGYESWNEYLEGEFSGRRLFLGLPREEQVKEIKALRDSGMSLRAIEAATGVSKSNTTRLLAEAAEATVPNGTVESVPVIGVDGRSYNVNTAPRPASKTVVLPESEFDWLDTPASSLGVGLNDQPIPAPRTARQISKPSHVVIGGAPTTSGLSLAADVEALLAAAESAMMHMREATDELSPEDYLGLSRSVLGTAGLLNLSRIDLALVTDLQREQIRGYLQDAADKLSTSLDQLAA